MEIDGSLVRALVARQFPRWAHLPLAEVRSAGTDNVLYRLGTDLVVRLPRLAPAAEAVAKEQRWLPRLAPLLPLAVPVPVGEGAPDRDYPLPLVGVPVAGRRGSRLAARHRPRRRGGPPVRCGHSRSAPTRIASRSR
jgi:aminoglycoside phosphotransferase (APT) family kinase protein